MIKVREDIVIEGPLADVFALYEDHEQTHHWQPSLIRKTAAGHLRKGTRVTEVHNFMGTKLEIKGAITEYEKDKLIGFTGSGPTLKTIHYENRFSSTKAGKATKVEVVAEFDPHDLFGLARPLIERAARRDIRASLESAKDAIEMAEQHAHVRAKAPVHDHHKGATVAATKVAANGPKKAPAKATRKVAAKAPR